MNQSVNIINFILVYCYVSGCETKGNAAPKRTIIVKDQENNYYLLLSLLSQLLLLTPRLSPLILASVEIKTYAEIIFLNHIHIVISIHTTF